MAGTSGLDGGRRWSATPTARDAATFCTDRLTTSATAWGLGVQFELAGLDLRDVEDVVDDADEAVGVRQRHVHQRARDPDRRSGSSASSNWSAPLMEVSGVRSSCETIETNSLLRRSTS